MNKADKNAWTSLIVVIAVGVLVTLAGSQGGAVVGSSGLPVFALTALIAFGMQWLGFAAAYALQTEKFFDLTGAITYVSVTLLAVLLSPKADARTLLLMILVFVWAGRLGTFLFLRVLKAGKDARFDELKPSFPRFLNTWTLQGLWITLTAAAALAAISNGNRQPMGVLGWLGLLVWLVGFGFEAIADAQKSRWRAQPENKGKFIDVGLWSRSRHPNYFGEIVLWIGVALIAAPVLQGWQWVTLISPVFVTLLLTKVSGVPMLEKRSDEKWGGNCDPGRL